MNRSVDVQTPPVSLTLNHLPFQGRHGRFAPDKYIHQTTLSRYFATLSCWIIRFMASMPTRTAPEVSSVIFMNRPAFSRS